MNRLTIDGRTVEVGDGVTVLDAARRLGIDIPTLCHHPAVEPYGACRICVVEIGSGARAKLATACTHPARDGLEVRTESEGARKARGFILGLLLARCPGSEELRSLARRLGVEAPTPQPGGVPAMDGERCILCGLCVRVCREVVGSAAIGFTGRGAKRAVETPFLARSEACIGCGACAAVCPTGAVLIQDRGGVRALETWHTELERARCPECGALFATARALERVREALGISLEATGLCGRCRRRKLGKDLAATRAEEE